MKVRTDNAGRSAPGMAPPSVDMTFMILAAKEPYRASLPALVSDNKDVLLPKSITGAIPKLFLPPEATGIDDGHFRRLAAQSKTSPGMRPKHPTYSLTPVGKKALESFDHLPSDVLERGLHAVGPQSEGWSCGVNGMARMLAMIGRPVPNYQSFLDRAPRAFSFLGNSIGPGPRALTDYTNSVMGEKPSKVYVMEGDFEHQYQRFRHSFGKGWPSLILHQVSASGLHWVNLVGFHKEWGDTLVMDSDGHLRAWSGGHDELWGRMWIANHMACKMGFLSDYNTIAVEDKQT